MIRVVRGEKVEVDFYPVFLSLNLWITFPPTHSLVPAEVHSLLKLPLNFSVTLLEMCESIMKL